MLIAVLVVFIMRAVKQPYLIHQWHKAFSNPVRIIAAIILLSFAIVGVLDSIHYRANESAQVYSVLDSILSFTHQYPEVTYSAPSMQHIFGTDKIGTDIFYISMKSIRTGLIIGILTTIITLPFAILFGAMAGYYRGWVDDLIQYVYITLSSVPAVLLIAAAVLTLDVVMQRNSGSIVLMAERTDMRLLMLCCVLGLTSWTSLCRLLRGETLKLRAQDFVLASKSLGASNLQIILKHIVPNLMHIILIAIVLDFSGLVLAEAVLTYVGVGVDPSTYSWGNMINSARMEMGREPIIWWPLAGAFVFMFTLVLAANIFADGVRDVKGF